MRMPTAPNPPGRGLRLLTLLGVTELYVGAGKLGLYFASLHASASPVWPPTGIALAALLLLGYRVWPAVFAGAFIVNLTTLGTLVTSLGIATGNTLEGVVSAMLVNRLAGGSAAFDRAQHIFAFCMLAGPVSTTVSATIGLTTLAVAGYAPWGGYGALWLTWWLGDVAGALVISPFLILWYREPDLTPIRRRPLETVLLLATVTLVALFLFGGFSPIAQQRYPLAFLCIPPLLWAAFRFGQRVASTVIVLLTGFAVIGTLAGFGPFVRDTLNVSLLLLQAFLTTLTVTALPLAALVWERSRADEVVRLREEQLQLALEAAHMGTWDWTIVTGEVRWSPALEAIHGLPAGSFGGSYADFQADMHPDDRAM